MTQFLIHQNRAGDPLGVWDESDYYYPDGTPDEIVNYGEAATQRGYDQSWPEFMEQQASLTPSPSARWDIFEHEDAPLNEVFDDALAATS